MADKETVSRLMRKYPRLCSNLSESKIPMSLPDLELRSDLWMIKFMEDCYTDAYSACFKEVSKGRRRKRCGLELGSMDAFPMVAQRFISRVYSVMELRYKVCIEFLISMEAAMGVGDITNSASKIGSDAPDNTGPSLRLAPEEIIRKCLKENNSVMCVNSERALIFSKFLSEEWDVDYLAIFLHHREVLQTTLNINLKDMVVCRVVSIEESKVVASLPPGSPIDAVDITAKGGALKKAKTKHTPATVTVPSFARFVPDYTFPESPLISVHVERLAYICSVLCPTATLAQRAYLVDRILAKVSQQQKDTIKRISHAPSMDSVLLSATSVPPASVSPPFPPATPGVNAYSPEQLQERQTNINILGDAMAASISNSPTKTGKNVLDPASPEEQCILVEGTPVIPLYDILLVFLEEWKKIPPEGKNLSDAGKASVESLKELNTLYDNNCELMTTMTRTGKEKEAELRMCEGNLNKQEKICRKLERRWNDNIATADELMQLQEIRIVVTDIKAEKMVFENTLKQHNAELKTLKTKIEGLWDTALSYGIEITSKDSVGGGKKGKGKSASVPLAVYDKGKWRRDVQEIIVKAIGMNEELADIKSQALREMDGGAVPGSPGKGSGTKSKSKTVKVDKKRQTMKEREEERKRLKAEKEKEAPPPIPALQKKVLKKITRPETTEDEVPVETSPELPLPLPSPDVNISVCDVVPPPPELTADELEVIRRREQMAELEGIASDLATVGYSEAKGLGLTPVKDIEDAARMERERIAFELAAAERERRKEIKLQHQKEQLYVHDTAMKALDDLQSVVTTIAMHVAEEIITKNVMLEAEKTVDRLADVVESTLSPDMFIPDKKPGFLQRRRNRDWNHVVYSKSDQEKHVRAIYDEVKSTIPQGIFDSIKMCISDVCGLLTVKIKEDVREQVELQQAERASNSRDPIIVTLSKDYMNDKFGLMIEKNAKKFLDVSLNSCISACIVEISTREEYKLTEMLQKLRTVQVDTIKSLQDVVNVIANGIVNSTNDEVLDLTRRKLDAIEAQKQMEHDLMVEREVFDVLFDIVGDIEDLEIKRLQVEMEIDMMAVVAVDDTCDIIADDVYEYIKSAIYDPANAVETKLLYECYFPKDPWEELELSPSEFVPERTLETVEELFIIQQMAMNIVSRKENFNAWKAYSKKSKLARKFSVLQKKKRMFAKFMKIHTNHQLMEKMSKVIQKFLIHRVRDRKTRRLNAEYCRGILVKASSFCNTHRMLKKRNICMKYWVYRLRTQQKYHSVIFNLMDRRFIKTYYTWALAYKNHKKARLEKEARDNAAAWQIQCFVRMHQAHYKLFQKQCQKKIILGMRCAFARRAVILHERYLHRVEESGVALAAWKCRSIVRKRFRRMKRHYGYKEGLRKFRHWCLKRKVLPKFRRWKRQCDNLGYVRHRKATFIQSAFRMYIIQKYVLHYYSWRKNVKKFQAIYRGGVARRFFQSQIVVFRAAKKVQRTFRGHSVRSHMTRSRILAIHYAAGHNNYDKLNYYVEKYPELLFELDAEGNSALHIAAMNACRRTLKLLLRAELDRNALNFAGYSPLHLIIMSQAINRDDLALYMLERGFNEEIRTPDNKTCLLLACEYGRTTIVSQLLDDEMDPDIPDELGVTCLQTACTQGFYGVVKLLVEHGADVNLAGYGGTFPLHDCVQSDDVRIAEMLISHGAYVKNHEPTLGQSPLMYACAVGSTDIAKLYILQGADVSEPDYNGYTCAHHSTLSNNIDLYHALREADADFDGTDMNGNSSLHIAVEANSIEYVKALLEGGAYPSHQNKDGDQPVHLAAKYNFVDCLVALCRYCEHVGRVNNSHQTPLGVAKFHSSMEAIDYLLERYERIEKDDDRNVHGDLWWDKDIDTNVLSDWRVEVNDRGDRVYINSSTGEVSDQPPAYNIKDVQSALAGNEWTMRQQVQMIPIQDKVTKHEYERMYAKHEIEVNDEKRLYHAANQIIKTARVRLAVKELMRLKKEKARSKLFTRFFTMYHPNFVKNRMKRHGVYATKIQCAFRGHRFRNRYNEFFYDMVDYDSKCRKLARMVFKAYRNYKCFYRIRMMRCLASQPTSMEAWADELRASRKPYRTNGVYEVYKYKHNTDIFFYRHKINGICTLTKPKKLDYLDNFAYYEQCQMNARGFTTRQNNLVITLQKLWRGYICRHYYVYVEGAMKISMTAEIDYLNDPMSDKHLYNYTLHCHVVLRDYNKARRLYVECLERMAFRGPDFAFILYAYAIFAFVTHELDYSDILLLLARAQKAEETREILLRKKNGQLKSLAIENGTFRHGKVFEFAKLGFFRFSANSDSCGQSWYNYAVCCFLVYNDYRATFDAFLNAFKYDPGNKPMKENFDIFMAHFWGNDSHLNAEKVRERMAYIAEKDVEAFNIRTRRAELAQERGLAATKIQIWARQIFAKRGFSRFMSTLRLHTPAAKSRPGTKSTAKGGRTGKPPTGGGSSITPRDARSVGASSIASGSTRRSKGSAEGNGRRPSGGSVGTRGSKGSRSTPPGSARRPTPPNSGRKGKRDK